MNYRNEDIERIAKIELDRIAVKYDMCKGDLTKTCIEMRELAHGIKV